MVLIMLAKEALDANLGEKILEIGTGSGYNTALLSNLVGPEGTVYTIERHEKLIEFAQNNLENANIPNNYKIIHGDGTKGVVNMKFDKIIVTASGPYVPESLLDQLVDNGLLLIPVKTKSEELLLKIRKLTAGDNSDKYLEKNSKYVNRLRIDDLGGVRFVPLIGEFGYKK